MINHFNNIDWHATDRCNLRCVACGHMCSLVDHTNNNTDRTPEDAERDFSILYEKTNNGEYVDNISITGGECTLNKQLPEILDVAYKYFPNKISLWTNAINLHLYTPELIQRLQNYNITLHITIYNKVHEPNINTFLNINNLYAILYNKSFDTNIANTTFFTKFFTEEPIPNNNNNLYCTSKFNCCQLKDQKLYVCQYMGYLPYLFEYFGKEYADKIGYNNSSIYLDLTTVNNYEEIYNYVLDYNEDICAHCIDKWAIQDYDTRTKYRLVPWHTSNKQLNEWICKNIDEIIKK